MKKLNYFTNKIEIHPLSLLFLILILLANFYKIFFIYFLITLIHELGHVFMAFALKVEVESIKLLPIGFSAKIKDLDYQDTFKELLIVIAGPLTYFISFVLLHVLYRMDFISSFGLTQALQINTFILLFNLLPIYPLDGGRIIKIINDLFLTTKKSLIISAIISFIFVILTIYFTRYTPQWMIYAFLIFSQITFWVTLKKRYKLFLIDRYLKDIRYKDKVHTHLDLYRNKNNYLIHDKKIYNEKNAIKYLLLNKNRHNS